VIVLLSAAPHPAQRIKHLSVVPIISIGAKKQ
jgi:hypothetical protein